MNPTRSLIVALTAGALSVSSICASTPLVDLDFNTPNSATQVNAGSLGGSVTINQGGVSNSSLINIEGPSGDYALNLKSVSNVTSTTDTGATAVGTVASTNLTNFTISLWYQGAFKASNQTQRLFEAASGTNSIISLRLGQYGYIALAVNNISKDATASTSSPFYISSSGGSSTAWKFLAVTFSSAGDGTNSTATFYTSGETGTLSTVTVSFSGIIDPNAFTSYSVGNNGTDGKAFSGNLDEVQLYDYALSASEILNLRDVQAVPEPTSLALMILGVCALFWRTRRTC